MNPDALTFEQALEELEHVIVLLEQGGLALEDALNLYARGQTLLTYCQQRLEAAELRVRELASLTGAITTGAADAEDQSEV